MMMLQDGFLEELLAEQLRIVIIRAILQLMAAEFLVLNHTGLSLIAIIKVILSSGVAGSWHTKVAE
jgi:hypothetical protein